MNTVRSNNYDAVIIGAGVSGLVAGNYLVKAGFKTLILEHHYMVGGCCSSFKRSGFTFDSGAHSLGSCRPGGQITRVLYELGINNDIEIERSDPSDTVISGDLRIDLTGNIRQLSTSLASYFPSERTAILEFLNEVYNFDINQTDSFLCYYSKYKSASFKDMLNVYFKDSRLKSLLCVFLGNLGLASSQIAAMAAIAMFKEFVLDGGYYVVGGMQTFVDFLATSFKKGGGELLLKNKVESIVIKKGKVEGIQIKSGEFVQSKCVISTTGVKQTFLHLISREAVPRRLSDKAAALVSSISALVVYLGVQGSPINKRGWGRSVWYVPNGNADEIYKKVFNGGVDEDIELLLMAFPSHYDKTLAPAGCESLYLFLAAPYRDAMFWNENKMIYYDRIIKRVEELIPNLRSKIVVYEIATPSTIQRYTLNDDGAMYGLASTLDQFRVNVMPQESLVSGLYLASHWATVGAGQGGTPMAAYAGRSVARLILSKNKKQKELYESVNK